MKNESGFEDDRKRHVVSCREVFCHLNENNMSFCNFVQKRHVVYSKNCLSHLRKMIHFLRIEKMTCRLARFEAADLRGK